MLRGKGVSCSGPIHTGALDAVYEIYTHLMDELPLILEARPDPNVVDVVFPAMFSVSSSMVVNLIGFMKYCCITS